MMIYLLHFHEPITPGHPCQHYLGFTDELQARMNAHRWGHGARLTEVAAERGIDFILARVWQGSRSDERKLKNRKYAPKLCPYCSDNPISPKGFTEMKVSQ